MIEVVRTGALATIQDLGRVGYAHLGVPRSGAADLSSHRLANRLVGNDESAATVEFTLGGAAIRFIEPHAFAVTGAVVALRLDGRSIDMGQWHRAPAGTLLEMDTPSAGLRTYLAIAGGIDVEPVLGSRATDTLSGMGPARLAPGSTLRIGMDRRLPTAGSDAVVSTVAMGTSITLHYQRGPRDDMFAPTALESLETADWLVTAQSDRVASRLSGPLLARGIAGDIASEGMVLGAIQVPESGQPMVFLADHPATGGYPVLGVVALVDVAALAQARPGTSVRFARRRATR